MYFYFRKNDVLFYLYPFTFDNVLGLEQCQYDAVCEQLAVIDGSINHIYYKFTSTGQCSVGDTIVSRTVYVDGLQ
jgi:hypothetical protein